MATTTAFPAVRKLAARRNVLLAMLDGAVMNDSMRQATITEVAAINVKISALLSR